MGAQRTKKYLLGLVTSKAVYHGKIGIIAREQGKMRKNEMNPKRPSIPEKAMKKQNNAVW